jgi:hypothetical protein
MNKQQDDDGPSRFEGAQHGWSPDVGEGGSERATEANEKAFGAPPDESGPGRVVSDEERAGVGPTDTEPDAPHGVGVSTSKRAEEYGAEGEEDRDTLGTKGKSQRPYGTSDSSSEGAGQE